MKEKYKQMLLEDKEKYGLSERQIPVCVIGLIKGIGACTDLPPEERLNRIQAAIDAFSEVRHADD